MSIPQAIVKPTIFREYIGAKPYPDNLSDFPGEIINPKTPQFHFILASAAERYDNNGRGTGYFKHTWNIDYFGPENVKKLKEKYPHVKVIISIGGRGAEYPFNPVEKDRWPETAIKSLTKIIQHYNGVKNHCSYDDKMIDGIDINYDTIKSTDTDFAHCIGRVINGLKKEGLIKVVSIAPSDLTQSSYFKLYVAHGHDINWVHYQFYNQIVPSKDDFVKLHRKLSNDYDHKLLAGFSSDPNDAGKISREVFLDGCIDLINTGSLSGIFVWDANDSAAPKPGEKPFLLEEKAQRILLNPIDHQ